MSRVRVQVSDPERSRDWINADERDIGLVIAWLQEQNVGEEATTLSDHRNQFRKEPLYMLDILVSKPGRYLVVPLVDPSRERLGDT